MNPSATPVLPHFEPNAEIKSSALLDRVTTKQELDAVAARTLEVLTCFGSAIDDSLEAHCLENGTNVVSPRLAEHGLLMPPRPNFWI